MAEKNRTLVMMIKSEEVGFDDPWQLSLTEDQIALLKWLEEYGFIDGNYWVFDKEEVITI